MNAIPSTNTDLTESDFLPELKLEGKLHIFQPHPNDYSRLLVQPGIHESKLKFQHLLSKSITLKTLFIGYLVVKFLRKMKNSVIFPGKVSQQKLSMTNDLTYFPKKKIKRVSRVGLGFLSFLNEIKDSYLLILLKKLAESLPLFDEFPRFLKIWDAVQLVLIFLMVVVIPMNIFLEWIQETSILVLDQKLTVVCCFFFTFDVVIKFNRRILKKGVWIARRKEIALVYLKNLLLIDILSTVSLYLWDVLPILSLVFLSKIWYFQKLTELISLVKHKYFDLSLVFLIKIIQILLVSHYMACFWCYVGDYGSDNLEKSWIGNSEITYNQYISAFYFSFQTLVFDGNLMIQPTNTLEMFCLFIFKLIAIFNLFYNIINLVYILTDIYRKQQDARDELRDLQEYLQKNNKISPFLKSKITKLWQNQLKRVNKNKMQEKFKKISEVIPEDLKGEICLHLNDKIQLENYDFFKKNFTKETIRKLSQYLIKKNYYENQEIFTKGKLDDKSLYLILKGVASANVPIKEEIKIKKEYDIVGFESFFGNKLRSFTLSVLSKKLKVLKLSQEDFLKVIRENQTDYDKFCEIKDKIQFDSDFGDLFISCKICSAKNHDENQCPILFKNFNKKYHLQKLAFYHQNVTKRVKYLKRKTKKRRCLFSPKTLPPNFLYERDSVQSDSILHEYGSDEELRMIANGFEQQHLVTTVDIDRINLNRKENYFPQNHYERVIFEYNNNLRRRNYCSKELFLSWNFSPDKSSGKI